jgi:hypothetical protein
MVTDENIIEQVASRGHMLDLDIKAVMASTGFTEEAVIIGFIDYLQKRLAYDQKRNI